MMCKSTENLLILKLNHPISEDSVLKYIDSPSDYILRKRLGLDEEEVSAIRVAYGYYQETVKLVLENRLEKLRRRRETKVRTAI